jgi:hypothetical protein
MISAGAKRFIRFVGNVMLAHITTYFIAGAIAYPALTKQFYEGPQPIFASFMRTPAQPDLWRHAATWLLPGNLLRGLLIGLVLYPFLMTFRAWSFRRRFLVISGLYLALGFWASVGAAPGTIEGFIYMRPEVTPYAHLMVQPEIVIQGLAFGIWVAAAASPIMEEYPLRTGAET